MNTFSMRIRLLPVSILFSIFLLCRAPLGGVAYVAEGGGDAYPNGAEDLMAGDLPLRLAF